MLEKNAPVTIIELFFIENIEINGFMSTNSSHIIQTVPEYIKIRKAAQFIM